MKKMRIVLVVFSCLGVSLCFAALPSQRPPKSKRPSKSPTSDPALIDANGYREILQRHAGKPLLVNFWATWCEPCREEYPILNELAQKYASRGLVVVGISFDDDAEMNLVRHFLAKHQPVFTNYRKRPGNEEKFVHSVNPKWSGAIPATFFYTPDGHEFGHLIGGSPREQFEKAIRALLEAPAKRSFATERQRLHPLNS